MKHNISSRIYTLFTYTLYIDRFLWNLYCNDAGTYIIKADYVRNVSLTAFESVSLFSQSERANFEQFQDWIVKHRNATVLSKWLLADNCVSLTSELETPTFYQSLAGVTHLEEKVNFDLHYINVITYETLYYLQSILYNAN